MKLLSDEHRRTHLLVESTLVQLMAWCCQVMIHYLSHCWPRSATPYGITRPPWVKCTHICWLSLRVLVEFIYGAWNLPPLSENDLGAFHTLELMLIYCQNQVNTMAVDALALCSTRSSAAMVFTLYDKQVFVFQDEEFHLLVPSQTLIRVEFFWG